MFEYNNTPNRRISCKIYCNDPAHTFSRDETIKLYKDEVPNEVIHKTVADLKKMNFTI